LGGAGLAGFLLFAWASTAQATNPFTLWKDRLFGEKAERIAQESDPDGVVILGVDRPQRIAIRKEADQREFPDGTSRYREVELQRTFAHVALRIQVIAERNPDGRGNAVFKPVVHILDDKGAVKSSKVVEPLYLDIRPFRPTRLLACVPLDNVRRFALAASAKAKGKNYESRSRDKVKASSKGGFYYSTEPVKVSLPYVDTGEMIVEISPVGEKGKGC
jgi:hypothetical protein